MGAPLFLAQVLKPKVLGPIGRTFFGPELLKSILLAAEKNSLLKNAFKLSYLDTQRFGEGFNKGMLFSFMDSPIMKPFLVTTETGAPNMLRLRLGGGNYRPSTAEAFFNDQMFPLLKKNFGIDMPGAILSKNGKYLFVPEIGFKSIETGEPVTDLLSREMKLDNEQEMVQRLRLDWPLYNMTNRTFDDLPLIEIPDIKYPKFSNFYLGFEKAKKPLLFGSVIGAGAGAYGLGTAMNKKSDEENLDMTSVVFPDEESNTPEVVIQEENNPQVDTSKLATNTSTNNDTTFDWNAFNDF